MKTLIVAAALCAAGIASAQSTVATVGMASLSFEDLNSGDGVTPSASMTYGGGTSYGYYAVLNTGIYDNGPGVYLPAGSAQIGYSDYNGASSRTFSSLTGSLQSVTDPLGFTFAGQPIAISNIDSTDVIRYLVSANTRVTFTFDITVLRNGGDGYAKVSLGGDGCSFQDSTIDSAKSETWSCSTGDSAQVFGLARSVGTTKPGTAVPAVPEPSTWVLLLAALGLVGLRAHRARSTVSAS